MSVSQLWYFILIVFINLVLSSFAYSGTSVADNIRIVKPRVAEPACVAAKIYLNPLIQNISNGRIIKPEIRALARRADAMKALAYSAAFFASADVVSARAYADISVTGRRAYRNFMHNHKLRRVNINTIATMAKATNKGSSYSIAQLRVAAAKSLERVYRVIHWLRFGGVSAISLRRQLGYITVSGEDDLPWRPVNNESAQDFQYNLNVRVGRHVVNTRFIIAGPNQPRTVAYRPGVLQSPPSLRRLPSNAKVLIYVHGMDSQLEEAGDIIKALRRKYKADNWYVIAMDLPGSAYASHLDHASIAPLSHMGVAKTIGFDARGRQNVALLNFIENFVLRFVDTLDRRIVLKNKVWAVMGGSLGGNITLRLGRRNVAWIRNVVSWSPASIWNSAADDITRQVAIKRPYLRAGGDRKYINELSMHRAEFFKTAFGKEAIFLPAQDAQWWGESFACKNAYRRAARVQRYEIYDKNFRKWHWRLAAEQMLYSHQNPPNSRHLRLQHNRTPMLLAAGSEDNFIGAHIYDATRKSAPLMTRTPGVALFIQKTGHSIHNERPYYFTRQIVSFLKMSQRQNHSASHVRFSTVVIRGMTTDDDIRRNGNSKGWVGIKLRSGQIIWQEVTNQANRGKKNIAFSATIRLGRSLAKRDVEALLVRHHSGQCFACSRDHWKLRAELSAAGATLVRTGNFTIGHNTRRFKLP